MYLSSLIKFSSIPYLFPHKLLKRLQLRTCRPTRRPTIQPSDGGSSLLVDARATRWRYTALLCGSEMHCGNNVNWVNQHGLITSPTWIKEHLQKMPLRYAIAAPQDENTQRQTMQGGCLSSDDGGDRRSCICRVFLPGPCVRAVLGVPDSPVQDPAGSLLERRGTAPGFPGEQSQQGL